MLARGCGMQSLWTTRQAVAAPFQSRRHASQRLCDYAWSLEPAVSQVCLRATHLSCRGEERHRPLRGCERRLCGNDGWLASESATAVRGSGERPRDSRPWQSEMSCLVQSEVAHGFTCMRRGCRRPRRNQDHREPNCSRATNTPLRGLSEDCVDF